MIFHNPPNPRAIPKELENWLALGIKLGMFSERVAILLEHIVKHVAESERSLEWMIQNDEHARANTLLETTNKLLERIASAVEGLERKD